MVVHKAMPSRSASKSDKSVAFVIDTYPGDGLPSEVVLGNTNEVLSAFKPNQFYVLVLAAFTKTKVTSFKDTVMFSYYSYGIYTLTLVGKS